MEGSTSEIAAQLEKVQAPRQTVRELHWQRTDEQMRRTVDALGRPIDPGILDAVVALNSNKISTAGSCEGHLDHGLAAPWIDVSSPMAESMRDDFWALRERGATREELDHVRHQIERRNLVVRAVLLQELAAFYEHRHVPYDVRLTIQDRAMAESRLESQGASLQEIRDSLVRQRKLVEYRSEFNAFARYLRIREGGLSRALNQPPTSRATTAEQRGIHTRAVQPARALT